MAKKVILLACDFYCKNTQKDKKTNLYCSAASITLVTNTFAQELASFEPFR